MDGAARLTNSMRNLRGARNISFLLICIALAFITSFIVSRPVAAVFIAPNPTIVTWTPTATQTGTYTICVSDTTSFAQLQCVASIGQASFDVAPLGAQFPAGDTYWRVAPVDMTGLVGQWSEPQLVPVATVPPPLPVDPQIPVPTPPDNDPSPQPPVVPPIEQPNPNPAPPLPPIVDQAAAGTITAPPPIVTTGSAERLITAVGRLTNGGGTPSTVRPVTVDAGTGAVTIQDRPVTTTILPGQEVPARQGAVIDSTPNGWRIFGMPWYLWLVIIGIAIATVLFVKKIIALPYPHPPQYPSRRAY